MHRARFSDPIFVTLAGGSVGWQIGATSTDVVLVFMTSAAYRILHAASSRSAWTPRWPPARSAARGEAAAGVNAEIYSYSRSRGLFAGVALDGTVLAFDPGANRAFYGGDRAVTTDMITSAQVSTSDESARRFLAAVVADVGGTATPSATQAVGSPSTAPPPPAAAVPAPPTDNGTRTYPLQDTHPGAEPHAQ